MRTHKLLGSAFILLIAFTLTIPYAAAQNKKEKGQRPNPFDLIEMLQKKIQELELELDYNVNRTLHNANQLVEFDKKFTNTSNSLDNRITNTKTQLDHKIDNTTHLANNNANQLVEFDKKFTNTTNSLDNKIIETKSQLDHNVNRTLHNANQLVEFDKQLKNTTDSFDQKFNEITQKTDVNLSEISKLSNDLKHNVTRINSNIATIDSHDSEILALKQNFTNVEKNVLKLQKTKFRSQKSDLLALKNKRDLLQDLLLKKGIETLTEEKIEALKNHLPSVEDLKGLLRDCDLATKFDAAKGQPNSLEQVFSAIKHCHDLQGLLIGSEEDEEQFDETSNTLQEILEELQES